MTDLENPSQTVCYGDQNGRTLGLTTHFSEQSSKVCVNKLAKRKDHRVNMLSEGIKTLDGCDERQENRNWLINTGTAVMLRIGTKSSRTMSKITAYA
jgi:hypothetical protein